MKDSKDTKTMQPPPPHTKQAGTRKKKVSTSANESNLRADQKNSQHNGTDTGH
ncbi:hypothetical protein [Mucilaginibacter terrenus]|uniref:hypothetical protein n=1 Tax=Mucilaginibacter terrenus TaxID=2482727 RepID=UPI001403B83D|nr:hypothetical protein [Mucilaginibacter terrenus]